ncbi:ATP-binding protein [Lentzea sp. NPDC005914]|uniref:ATP-binding protein n=1 Tax=Lentzea sp. NPDC005914 TaxID=3154572 RepID=UPI0033E180C2
MKTVDEGPASVVLDLEVEPAIALSALRGHVAGTLRDLGEDHRYDVLLIVTELVSNVLDHTPGTGRLRILQQNAGCEVTIEVDDRSPAQPVYGRSRLGCDRGRGIVVVDNLARAWGTRPLPGGGKTVFASVRCPDDQNAAGSCRSDERD